MLRPVTIQYLDVKGAKGSVSDIIPMDIDGDGFLDLVGTSLHFPQQNKSIPVFALINDRKGGFEASGTGVAGSTVHAREFVVADFNGDGIDDIFIADHGYDVAPFPGHKNTLLLGKADGGFTNATSRLPNIKDFSHSATTADIDGDGDLDLFVGNINGGKSGPYILLNNGSAKFTKASLLPAEIANRSNTYTTSLFVDIDRDGDMDLFLGGDGGASAMLMNNGKGRFSLSKQKVPDGAFGAKNTISLDVQTFDFDRNGRNELLVVGTKAKPFYEKASLQILSPLGKEGKMVDTTKIHFDSQPNLNGWVSKIHFVDLNQDGRLDIVGQVANENAVLAYLNDGNNRFYQMSPKILMDYAGLSLTVMDVDNDGKKELVQVGSSNGVYGVQIVRTVTTDGDVAGSAAKDTVFGNGSSQRIDGRGGADFLAGGGGNDILLGGGGNDKLLGGNGDDILDGGAGKDILVGGRGADTLTGGAGADMFVFSSRHDSPVNTPDVITDFSRSQGDRIDLRAIDANTKSAGDQAFKFIGTDGFHKKAGELRYEKRSGDTFVLADVNGDGKVDFSIALDASINLKAGDFIL